MRSYFILFMILLLGLVHSCAPMQPANVSPSRQGPDPLPSIRCIDAQMDRCYAEIRRMYAHDAEFLTKLEAAQIAWRRFRTAHLESRYPASDKLLAYGRTFSRCYQIAYVAVTRQRIAQLQAWMDGSPEGDVCAGSIAFRPE